MVFDPYYKWLGIPPAEQPPNHYRLLGLSLFEQNGEAIDNAADRQMAHVRTFQAGPHGAHSQRLLNEIAAARLALLDPSKRRAYDEQLRAQHAPATPGVPPPMIVEVPAGSSAPPPESRGGPLPAAPDFASFAPAAPAVQVQQRAAPSRRPPNDLTVEILKIAGGGIAGLVLATLLLRVGFGIDMTGLFPVDKQKTRASVVQRPMPVDAPKETPGPGDAAPGSVKPSAPSSRPAPPVRAEGGSGDQPPEAVEKPKKKKGKNKGSQPAATNSAISDPPFAAESAPQEAASDAPGANPMASAAEFKVRSATLVPRRLPVPNDADRQARQQQLENIYQLSKLKEDDKRLTAAAELFGIGQTRTAPPADRWTALSAAAEVAADVGDARLVAQAMDALAQTFESDVLAEEAGLLAKAARGARTPEQLRALVETSRVTIQVALANHEYLLARDLASAVRNASDRPAGLPYRKFIFDGQREIVRQQEAWYAYREALTKLATAPDDADANLAAARWWILEHGDWDAALPYLAKSGKPLVKRAADLDQAKGKDWLSIANSWYEAGVAEPIAPLWLVRANSWYAIIDKAQISGLDGAHVDRRLEELSKNEKLVPLEAQIAQGRGAARLRASLPAVVRRHCMLALPFERADHFRDGKQFMICDRSGQANHGALHGVTPVAGLAGLALDFAGPEHYVECADQSSLNPTGAFTLCAWLWQRSVVHPQRIDDVLSKEEWGSGTGRGYSLRFDEGKPAINVGNGPDWLWVHAPAAAGLGAWFHLAAIYDGQNLALLVNGSEVGVQPTMKSVSVSGQPLRIGRGPFDENRRFDGLIDEVAVFDMALTAADLQLIIDLGRAGKCLAE
jgi:hypothetical protein